LHWGVVPQLTSDVLDVFPAESIFTPGDRRAHGEGPWPPVARLLEEGFRVMFVSSSDYGEQMESLVFPRGEAVCDWREPGLTEMDPATCRTSSTGFMNGSLLRTPSCEIQYGPLNCDFVWRNTNSPILDDVLLREVTACGLNVPSPDLLTPERAAAAVWTWAPGYPSPILETPCAYVAASDGRWRTSSCGELEDLPLACRATDAPLSQPRWVLERSGACPESTTFGPPRHPRENAALVAAVRSQSHIGARINLESNLTSGK
jgi:hypothetical protein